MRILLTNDDGVHSEGMNALIECVPAEMHAVIAAPATERSASSHSISLGQKLRVEEFSGKKFPCYAIHGTPADCVKFALGAGPGFIPDLIVSGINHGANTGISVYYSGTISAARGGFINGVPAMAVSLCSRESRDFQASMEITRRLIEGYAEKRLPLNTMLNVNVPPLEPKKIKGIKITKQASSRFIEEFVPEKSHDGKKVFTLAGEIEVLNADGTSDEEAVNGGYISITPLKIDLTEYKAIPRFQDWLNDCKIEVPMKKGQNIKMPKSE